MSDPRQRLDTPRTSRRPALNFDPDSIGRFSESIARVLGTGRYLMWQTILVIVWISLNLFAVHLRWDPYAAPLILLAQTRQENRDRIALEEDRRRSEQTKADTEFLARELAALRLAIGEVATRDYLRRELEEVRELLEALQPRAAGKLDSPERRPKRSQADKLP